MIDYLYVWMMKAIASWSGGKDGCFACYRALAQGHEVSHLVTFISQEFRRVSFHGTRARLISRQAQAIGIPLVQCAVPPDLSLYEQRFKRAVSALKRKGTEGMVFGAIYVQEDRDWIEMVCREVGVTPILPLWGMTPDHVLSDFVREGFEAMIISARADIFGEEWLGRRIDSGVLSDLRRLGQQKGVDICGERGEYHTLVLDGPLFRKRMQVTCGAKVQRNGYWLLDIPRYRVESK